MKTPIREASRKLGQQTLEDFEPTVTMYFPADKKDRETGELVGEKTVKGLGPSVITPETVRYWCRHTRELKGNQVTKAEQFVAHNCLHYMGNNRFVCLPLNTKEEIKLGDRVFKKQAFKSDYNTSEYAIVKLDDNTFRCNCQGWATKEKRGEIVKEGANCSHVLALYYAFKLKRFKEQALQVTYGKT